MNTINSVTKVDVLIPVHALPALEALCNSENRKKSGVLESNNFIFAQANKAEGRSSGSADLKVIIDKALQFDENHKNVAVTKMRHLLSTMFEERDENEDTKNVFYKHLGDDQRINQEVYQTPPAFKIIKSIGPFFSELDDICRRGGKKISLCTKLNYVCFCDFPVC